MYLHAIYHLDMSLIHFNVYGMKPGLSIVVTSNINKHFPHDQTVHPTTLQEGSFPSHNPCNKLQISKLSLWWWGVLLWMSDLGPGDGSTQISLPVTAKSLVKRHLHLRFHYLLTGWRAKKTKQQGTKTGTTVAETLQGCYVGMLTSLTQK
jgi:hypothetical protein